MSFYIGLCLGMLIGKFLDDALLKIFNLIYLIPGYNRCKKVFFKYGKIHAIKEHRAIYNSSLKEAKEEIEKWFNFKKGN